MSPNNHDSMQDEPGPSLPASSQTNGHSIGEPASKTWSSATGAGRRNSILLRAADIMSASPAQYQQVAEMAANLAFDPGDRYFLIVFKMSTWLPIVAAHLGPISNLNSVMSLAERWRVNKADGTAVTDKPWVLGVNAVSLFLGCVANMNLFLMFSGRVKERGQWISISFWYAGCVMLLVLLVLAQYSYFREGSGYEPSSGYWNAVVTSVLYFVSATMLLINRLGYRYGMYSQSLNLSTPQRRIMFQNVLIMAWLGAGGGVFSKLLGITYFNGVYYCMVTILTVGLGDIVPRTTLARALCLPYALAGVTMVGLVVASIRSSIVENEGLANVLSTVELTRRKYAKRLNNDTAIEHDVRAGFSAMRSSHARAEARYEAYTSLVSILIFCVFILIGAAVFSALEDWTYFEGVYFCGLCLLTIGYGDLSASTAGGRVFFIVWAVMAVPMMTTVISYLSDTLFNAVLKGGDIISERLLFARSVPSGALNAWKRRWRLILGLPDTVMTYDEVWDQDTASDDNAVGESGSEQGPVNRRLSMENDATDQILRGLVDSNSSPFVSPREGEEMSERLHRAHVLMQLISSLTKSLATNPERQFSYEQWATVFELCGLGDKASSPEFWLSEDSPLRYPIVEARYFIAICTRAMEALIAESKKAG